MITPPIRWPGGKRWLAKEIIGMMPEHACYVEVFGGGAAVLLSKPKSRIEVYNDINAELVNFFRVAKYHLEPLLGELEYMVSSREIFNRCTQHPGETDIQRAAIWFYRNKNGFGGINSKSFGRSKSGGGSALSSRSARLDKIRAMNDRLDSVCIENKPFSEIFRLYDAPQTLFFCDPPYAVNDKTYRGSPVFSYADHATLAEMAMAAQGQCILTLEATEEMQALYANIPVVKTCRRKRNVCGSGREIAEMILLKAHR